MPPEKGLVGYPRCLLADSSTRLLDRADVSVALLVTLHDASWNEYLRIVWYTKDQTAGIHPIMCTSPILHTAHDWPGRHQLSQSLVNGENYASMLTVGLVLGTLSERL
jgi:hypothetical protein